MANSTSSDSPKTPAASSFLPKNIAVDFDGTLVENEYPAIGKPIWKNINWCITRRNKGDRIYLYTLRQGELLEDAILYLQLIGLELDGIYYNKPTADLFLDDRNVVIDDA